MLPAPVPFRDRPVLEHIVEQHAEEAAFLWTLRDAATDAPHYKRHHLARLDERVEAHVDGLRVAGEAGWRIALEQLERRCEKGELFAAGVLALESGDMRRIEPLVARALAEPDARRGFVGAVAWCRPGVLAPVVRGWNGSARAFERRLALCACSVRRADPGAGFAARLEDEDGPTRSRALRLAGELGRTEALGACLRGLDDGDPDARFSAAWSGVLLGDRGRCLSSLEEAAVGGGPHRSAALETACRAAGLERATAAVRAMNGDPALLRRVVEAVGHAGDPAAVPWLVSRMERPDLARVAGEAFSTITGADLADAGLELREAPAPAPAAPGGDDPAEDPDEHLPWPDAALARAWWERHEHRFARGVRHLLGAAIAERGCGRAWSEGYQRQRRAAAYEAALADPRRALGNWAARGGGA